MVHVLYALYFDLCAFEAYAAISKADSTNPLAAPMFESLVGYSFIQVQAVRIRRLCEQTPQSAASDSKPPSKPRDDSIYSLRRIVDDIRQLRKGENPLLTS